MIPAYKILLVENDEAFRFIVKANLMQNHYTVLVAEDGQKALELINNNSFDLIILDVMPPENEGFRVAKTIRKKDEQTPIIFISDSSSIDNKITGLTIGGDDYITKPFSMEELLLKIKIFLKRSQVKSLSIKSFKIGEYIFRPGEQTLTINDNVTNLTVKEVALIKYFIENTNKTLLRNEILEKVWGSIDYFLGRSLDVFISRLRKYFAEDANIKIINLHGIGFRFYVKSEEDE